MRYLKVSIWMVVRMTMAYSSITKMEFSNNK